MGKTSRFKRPPGKRPLFSYISLFLVSSWLILLITVWLKWGTAIFQSVPSSETTDATKAPTKAHPPPPVVLLSVPIHTHVTTDVRGNLGPASVLIENGTDWLKSRWQAASDMHGTAIVGMHWVDLEFDAPVHLTCIVLDWETAYSDDYKVEGKSHDQDHGITFVLDTQHGHDVASYRTVREEGRSPGVPKLKLPMHVIHTWNMTSSSSWQDAEKIGIDSLRLVIRKPFHSGWGVSLWKVDVFGYRHNDDEAVPL
jgi:hypothetical protein